MIRRLHHTSSFRDRHGKLRWIFRKAGLPSHYFESPYGSEAFRAEWRGCFDGTSQAQKAAEKVARTAKPSRGRQEKALVYFVGGDTGPIKIGHSRHLDRRLRDIQWGNHEKVRLLASAPGGQRAEARYHKRFIRHRLEGEWFSRAPEILQEIDRLTGNASNPIKGKTISAP